MSPVLAVVAARLHDLGFKKRAGTVFTREVAEDVLGWLGLNHASRHLGAGEVEVNPVVGIRHQGIERVVSELRGDEVHKYQPPTVSTPLGYVMPGSRYRAWVLGASDTEASSDGIVAAVAGFGLPFMESGSSLSELCRLLDQDVGFEHQLVYRRPVAWAFAGDLRRSAELIDAAEVDVGDRTDAAAAELRAFVAAFRRRFGLSSSG